MASGPASPRKRRLMNSRLDMGFHCKCHHLIQKHEEIAVVRPGTVTETGKVYGDVLDRRITPTPNFFRGFRRILSTEGAAASVAKRRPPIEGETGFPSRRQHRRAPQERFVAGVRKHSSVIWTIIRGKQTVYPRRPPDTPSQAPGKPLRFIAVFTADSTGGPSAGTDGGQVGEERKLPRDGCR